jgi:hypothetical protein
VRVPVKVKASNVADGNVRSGSQVAISLQIHDNRPYSPYASLPAALRRKRYQCPNWRDDFRRLFTEAKWPKINLDVRKSTILAGVYGDLERVNELLIL